MYPHPRACYVLSFAASSTRVLLPSAALHSTWPVVCTLNVLNTHMNSTQTSPQRALVPVLAPDSDTDSPYPILHASNQIVLYDPTSHALTIHPSDNALTQRRPHRPQICPYCSRPFPPDDRHDISHEFDEYSLDADLDRFEDVTHDARAENYFQLLAVVNESSSRPVTPPPSSLSGSDDGSLSGTSHDDENGSERSSAFGRDTMAAGYFKAFFKEEARLGMGASGSVYLCQHVLNGNPLGHFAVKKIAVGQSASYLLQILREVRLLESLHHPNIITYHHAWLENAQFSSFGPVVPTLHVLMQWAEGGSLDDYIDARLGRDTQSSHIPPSAAAERNHASPASDGPIQSRSARIRAFRAMKHAPPEERERLRTRLGMNVGGSDGRGRGAWKAVHLFSAEEVLGLFGGVVEGLSFLHDKTILHLDLKPGNVLLTWDQGTLIPRAMLSDFGTSRDMINSSIARSGNTGTLEYTSPESLPAPPSFILPPVDSKSDMWSLGMVLHKMLFFRLPYHWSSDGEGANGTEAVDEGSAMDRLEKEVLAYPGFTANSTLETVFTSRRLPQAYLVLLESLLNIVPSSRPSSERVQQAIRSGKVPYLPLPIHQPELIRRPCPAKPSTPPQPLQNPRQLAHTRLHGPTRELALGPPINDAGDPARTPPSHRILARL
ncbi:kinase-like domain-containing protein [Amylostereum chailletii]|nr:kinase-like domain-containing protein [Amylostereum chailletii]